MKCYLVLICWILLGVAQAEEVKEKEETKKAVTASTITGLQRKFGALKTEIQKKEMAMEESEVLVGSPISGSVKVLRAEMSTNKKETEMGKYKVFGYLVNGGSQICVVCIYTNSPSAQTAQKESIYRCNGILKKVAGAFYKNMTLVISEPQAD